MMVPEGAPPIVTHGLFFGSKTSGSLRQQFPLWLQRSGFHMTVISPLSIAYHNFFGGGMFNGLTLLSTPQTGQTEVLRQSAKRVPGSLPGHLSPDHGLTRRRCSGIWSRSSLRWKSLTTIGEFYNR